MTEATHIQGNRLDYIISTELITLITETIVGLLITDHNILNIILNIPIKLSTKNR